MAEQWIKSINMKKGSLTAQAKEKGMSISEFCAQKGLALKTQKRCVLAKTLKGFKK